MPNITVYFSQKAFGEYFSQLKKTSGVKIGKVGDSFFQMSCSGIEANSPVSRQVRFLRDVHTNALEGLKEQGKGSNEVYYFVEGESINSTGTKPLYDCLLELYRRRKIGDYEED